MLLPTTILPPETVFPLPIAILPPVTIFPDPQEIPVPEFPAKHGAIINVPMPPGTQIFPTAVESGLPDVQVKFDPTARLEPETVIFEPIAIPGIPAMLFVEPSAILLLVPDKT
jgi:hypothetical protein